MLPQVTFFGITIALYGASILAGLFVGIIIAIFLGKRISLSAEDVLFTFLFGIIGLAVGGKLLYLLTNLQPLWESRTYILEHKEAVLELLGGGFVFYGGLVGAVIMAGIYCRRYQIPAEQMARAVCPVIPLIHAFGRIGCFFAGCCYGIRYTGAGHIVFTQAAAAPNLVPLFPVQLAEAAANLLLFFFLLVLFLRKRKGAVLAAAYAIGYGCIRFLLEYLRGDRIRGFWFGCSTSQWLSLLLIFFGIWILLRERHRRRIKY